MQADNTGVLKAKLNRETATIHWAQLQRFFAAGTAIAVAQELDLITVAAAFSKDDAKQLKHWMSEKTVAPVSDAQASHWSASNSDMWAVVVAPWVLVQQKD